MGSSIGYSGSGGGAGVNFDRVSLDDFEMGKKLGKGSFGEVFKIKFKHNGQKYALKRLEKKFIEQVRKFYEALC